jgi:2'-5' RNA ligase
MRLFIAIPTPDEINKHVEELQNNLPKSNAKLTIAKHPHLTLKFLGEVTPEDLEKTKQALSLIEFKQFQAKLNGIGTFTDKVVWLGVEPHKPFEILQQKIDKALLKLFPKEEKFHPHITLARIKEVIEKQGFADLLKKIPVKPFTFIVDRIILYQSIIGQEGHTYKELAEFNAKQI